MQDSINTPTWLTSVWSVRPLGGAPNYYPNSFSAPETQPRFVESKFKVSPDVARYNTDDEDNVTQVKIASHFYRQVFCGQVIFLPTRVKYVFLDCVLHTVYSFTQFPSVLCFAIILRSPEGPIGFILSCLLPCWLTYLNSLPINSKSYCTSYKMVHNNLVHRNITVICKQHTVCFIKGQFSWLRYYGTI